MTHSPHTDAATSNLPATVRLDAHDIAESALASAPPHFSREDQAFFLDRLATHILAFEGNSHVEWFEGNFEAYEEDKRRRLGDAADRPTRLAYKKLTR